MHIVSVFLLCLQDKIQEDKEEQLNFILPGCLIPFQKEIKRLFVKEKMKFLRNKRFSIIFSKCSLKPVFKNRDNLKKLISKTKINPLPYSGPRGPACGPSRPAFRYRVRNSFRRSWDVFFRDLTSEPTKNRGIFDTNGRFCSEAGVQSPPSYN